MYSMIVQPAFIQNMTPYTSPSPLAANSYRSRFIIFQSNKRATGCWRDIRLTAKVLDHGFTSVVADRGHVKRTSLLFTAVESQLNEREVRSELIHGTLRQKSLIIVMVAYTSVWRLYWQLRCGRWAVNHCVGHKKPASWYQTKLL